MKGKLIFIAWGSIIIFLVLTSCAVGQSGAGEVVVRVDDTSGSHCIDADTEKITLFLRRVFTEKRRGIFTQDNRAGVLVRTQLSAANSDSNSSGQSSVQVPSVDLVSVKDDNKGRVSLALEYSVASGFVLTQGTNATQSMDVYINLATVKGKTSFGDVLDLAGQALQQIPLPPNPYTQAGSKFLKFANDAVNASVNKDNAEQIAHIAMKFNQGAEPDLKKCGSAGNERTGAVAVLRSIGAEGVPLIPVTNTEKLYCFRYSSGSTYELLAAKRADDGSCPAPSSFEGVPNDYVMLLISAQPVKRAGGKAVLPATFEAARKESEARCRNFKVSAAACGQ
jgi:hypothetical protein